MLVRVILMGAPVVGEPSVGEMLQRSGVESVELVTAFASSGDDPSGHEDIDVLRHSLSRRRDRMPGRQPRTQLEQRLIVAVSEFVQDRTASGVCQGLEHIAHSAEQ